MFPNKDLIVLLDSFAVYSICVPSLIIALLLYLSFSLVLENAFDIYILNLLCCILLNV